MSNKQRKSIAAPIAIVVILLLLPACYVIAYLALLDDHASQLALWDPPSYRLGGSASRTLLAPIHYLDAEFVRRELWASPFIADDFIEIDFMPDGTGVESDFVKEKHQEAVAEGPP